MTLSLKSEQLNKEEKSRKLTSACGIFFLQVYCSFLPYLALLTKERLHQLAAVFFQDAAESFVETLSLRISAYYNILSGE